MFLEFEFEVKILRRCGLYLFLCIQQPSSFHLLYYFPNNLHNSNFYNFSRSDKNVLSLMGNIHLHTITSLQYLPPDVRHFAFNAVRVHLLYYFPNNLHNLNFYNFSKSDKNVLSLMRNIHLHTITRLQYLPPDVRHFAFNAVREAGKKW